MKSWAAVVRRSKWRTSSNEVVHSWTRCRKSPSLTIVISFNCLNCTDVETAVWQHRQTAEISLYLTTCSRPRHVTTWPRDARTLVNNPNTPRRRWISVDQLRHWHSVFLVKQPSLSRRNRLCRSTQPGNGQKSHCRLHPPMDPGW